MKGLVISWTVALEANNTPTLTFSLTNMLLDWGQSLSFCGSPVVMGAVGATGATGAAGVGSVGQAVTLELRDLTLLSYKDTMLWKAPGGPRWSTVALLEAAPSDSSRLYR